jgi:hypothetical protein
MHPTHRAWLVRSKKSLTRLPAKLPLAQVYTKQDFSGTEESIHSFVGSWNVPDAPAKCGAAFRIRGPVSRMRKHACGWTGTRNRPSSSSPACRCARTPTNAHTHTNAHTRTHTHTPRARPRTHTVSVRQSSCITDRAHAPCQNEDWVPPDDGPKGKFDIIQVVAQCAAAHERMHARTTHMRAHTGPPARPPARRASLHALALARTFACTHRRTHARTLHTRTHEHGGACCQSVGCQLLMQPVLEYMRALCRSSSSRE